MRITWLAVAAAAALAGSASGAAPGEELSNFFYAHRGGMAFAPAMFEEEDWVKFMESEEARNQRSGHGVLSAAPRRLGGRKEEDADADTVVHSKFLDFSTFPAVFKGQSDPVEQMKDLEGHPYVIAYAMQKIKARGGETTAAAHAGQRWIDQGIEIDVYLPNDVGETASAIVPRMLVGHGTAKIMAKEVLLACGVASEMRAKHYTFEHWMALMARVLCFLDGDSSYGCTRKTGRQVTEHYERVFGVPLKLVLDLKCAPGNAAILPDVIRVLNRDYGIVVSAVGAFFTLDPAIDAVEQPHGVKAERLFFFFNPREVKDAVAAGRVEAGSNVLVATSSVVRPQSSVHEYNEDRPCELEVNPFTEGNLMAAKEDVDDLHIGLWCQEADLDDVGFRAIAAYVNEHADLYDLGWALGGPHAASEWPLTNSDGKCRRGGSSTLPLVNPVGVNRDFDVRMSKGWDKARRAVGGTIDSVRKLGDDAGVAVKDLALKGVKNLLSGRPLWQSEEEE